MDNILLFQQFFTSTNGRQCSTSHKMFMRDSIDPKTILGVVLKKKSRNYSPGFDRKISLNKHNSLCTYSLAFTTNKTKE